MVVNDLHGVFAVVLCCCDTCVVFLLRLMLGHVQEGGATSIDLIYQ